MDDTRNTSATTHRITGAAAVRVLIDLVGPSIAAGAIARRPQMVRILERLQADHRSVQRLRALRYTYGRGPVELVIPGRRIVVVLEPDDVADVLAATPSPFDPASWEKRRALQQFQPHAVLITQGALRGPRRTLNEQVLNTQAPVHHLAEPFNEVIASETSKLAAVAVERGGFDAARFTTMWWRLVREVVLGPSARNDDAVTDDLWRLRRAGHWSFAAPQHRIRRARFLNRLHRYAQDPAPESLLGALSAAESTSAIDPIGQIPHWLFAFDAAGMATVRALALLASHPGVLRRCEIDDLNIPQQRSYLGAAVLESLRLWPTTPTLLRDTTADTTWRDGGEQFTVKAGAMVLICVPAFHRDETTMEFADRFEPDIWLDGRAETYPQLVPFSAGPAACPGRNLVLFTTSTVLAHLLRQLDIKVRTSPPLRPGEPLPLTLNQFGLQFAASPARVRLVSP
jgi:cytochrome P450